MHNIKLFKQKSQGMKNNMSIVYVHSLICGKVEKHGTTVDLHKCQQEVYKCMHYKAILY
jgi:hypothetical protein